MCGEKIMFYLVSRSLSSSMTHEFSLRSRWAARCDITSWPLWLPVVFIRSWCRRSVDRTKGLSSSRDGQVKLYNFKISGRHKFPVRSWSPTMVNSFIQSTSLSLFSPVPSAVGNLRLAPQPGLMDSTAGLLATWTHGDGDRELYAVSLSTPVSLTANTSITRGTCVTA